MSEELRIRLEFKQTRRSPDVCVWEAKVDGIPTFWVANGPMICPQLYLVHEQARANGEVAFQRIARAVLSQSWPANLQQITFGIYSDLIYDAVDLEGR